MLNKLRYLISVVVGAIGLCPAYAVTQSKDVLKPTPSAAPFTVRILVDGLRHPWGMAWLPSGELLITERDGFLRRVSKDFSRISAPIGGLPEVSQGGQAGLFDVAVHPGYAQNGWIYLSLAESQTQGSSLVGTARHDPVRICCSAPSIKKEPGNGRFKLAAQGL